MIVDVLFGTLSDYGFTGDNTVPAVDIADGGANDGEMFPATTIEKYLAAQDNFIILSAMLACPYGYLPGQQFPRFDLLLKQFGGLAYPLQEFGSDGVGIRFPGFNQWVDLNIPVTYSNYFASGKGILMFDSIVGNVSQAGMPALLNGQDIKIIPAVKILHTLPLVA